MTFEIPDADFALSPTREQLAAVRGKAALRPVMAQLRQSLQFLAGIQVPENVVLSDRHETPALRGHRHIAVRPGQFPLRRRTFRRGNLPEPHRTIFSAADEPPSVRR